VLNNELVVQPQWKQRKVRLYLNNPQTELDSKHHLSFPMMRGKCRKDMMKLMMRPIIQYGAGKRIAEITKHFQWKTIVEKRFLIRGVERIKIPYTYNDFEPMDEYLNLEFIDVLEPFLSYLIQSGIEVFESINLYGKVHHGIRDVTEEYIDGMSELFSNLATEEENVEFDSYIDSWAKRLLIMPQIDLNKKVK